VTEADREVLARATDRAAPSAGGVKVGDDHVRLLRSGDEAYPAMLAAIETARREIVIEFYWFGSDAVGRQFCDALAERAREGVVVRVIYDAFGSTPVDGDMFDGLRASGADVRTFHPFLGIQGKTSRWVFRDHRKLLVCDGEVGFTGGLNIGRPWAAVARGGEGWRDDMVEVRGPTVRELRVLFYETWRRVLKRRERREPALLPRDALSMTPYPLGPVWALATGRGWKTRRQIRATYVRWIQEARRTIDIVNAYFVPDRTTRRAIVRAVQRGVSVRIVVPAHGDVPFVQWAVEAGLERLTKAGVRAWAYTGAVLHSKTAVVDETLSTIGSYNLDHRSIRYNLEVNLAVDSPEFGALVRRSIDRDIESSAEWTHDKLKARGFFRRLLGEFALLFARFL
jgi:cardiolipin synthase